MDQIYRTMIDSEIITPEDVPPLHNLWMDCSKAKRFGVTFSSALDGLLRCAKDYRIIDFCKNI